MIKHDVLNALKVLAIAGDELAQGKITSFEYYEKYESVKEIVDRLFLKSVDPMM